MYGGESEIGGPSRPIPSGSSSHIFAQNDVAGGGRSETPDTAARETNVVEGRDIPRSMSGDQGASNSTRSVHVRQRPLPEAFHEAKKKELDEKWASFFYEANVPFNVARNPAFIEAVKATSKARFDYVPPSYHQLRTNLIEPKRKQIQKEIEEKTKFAVKNYGVSICTDGWDDVNRRPLLNVMMSCPAGDVFLGSIDTTGQKKNMRYIADELKVFIEKVGPENVTQVCTDNAPNMLGAVNNIIREYPHIFKQGCMAHALDLMLEDWAKVREFKDLIERARKLCLYIRNHHATMGTFRQLSPKLALIVPAETRFACNMLMVDRLVKLKGVLERVKDHPRVQNYFSGLRDRQNAERAATAARNVVITIQDVAFWQRCTNFVHMTADVLKALRVFDGQEPAMGRAWLTMHNLREHVFSLRNPPYNLRADIATTLEDSFEARREMVLTDLHYAGAYLNPYLKDHPKLQEDPSILRGLYRVVTKLEGVLGVKYDDIMVELQQYDEGRGPYSPDMTPNVRATNMLPHQWWHRVADTGLSKIAVRVLALTCSASSCERNWSIYSFVHNKSRNRLAPEKAKSLVYIYTNSRVLRKRAKPDPIRWYDANILSEDSDADDLGPIPVDEANHEFDAMRVEEGEENDMEANRAPQEYRPNGDIWAEGADHLDEARNYYGDGNAMDEDHEGIPWGQGPWNRSPPRRSPSPLIHPNVGDHAVQLNASSSENEDSVRGPNRVALDIPPRNDVEGNNPLGGNSSDNGDDDSNGDDGSNGGGGGRVENTQTPNCEGSVVNRNGTGGLSGVGASPSSPRRVERHHALQIRNASRLEAVEVNHPAPVVPNRFNPSLPGIHDAFEFTEEDDNGIAPIAVPSVIVAQNTPTPSSLPPSSPAFSNAIGGVSQEGSHGRPPTFPKPYTRHPIGQYQHGRNGGRDYGGNEGRRGLGGSAPNTDRVGSISRGITEGRLETVNRGEIAGAVVTTRHGENVARGGRNDRKASSSRLGKRPLIGIGARDPNTAIEPYLDTYVPGRTSSTPAFVVPGGRSGTFGPTVNSDAEDPTARRHKRIRTERNLNGDRIPVLRNESTCSSSSSDSEPDVERGSNNSANDEGDTDCDEAPTDDDVVIRDANIAGPSTQARRTSRRFNN